MSPKKPGIAGSALVADLKPQKAKDKGHPYWVGLTVDELTRGAGGITCAGISFPRVTEELPSDKNALTTMNQKRVTRPGSIVWLSDEQLKRLAAALPRLCLRFDRKTQVGGNGFRKISIPTVDQEAAFAKVTPWKQFKQHQSDQPFARFCYCVPAPGGKRHSHSDLVPDWHNGDEREDWNEVDTLPPPLERTGLALPASVNGKGTRRTRRPRTVALTNPELPKTDGD